MYGSIMEAEKYRTGSKRFWAAIIDSLVFLPLVIVEEWLEGVGNISLLFGWATLSAFLPLVYSVILHHRWGQTVGKRVAGVKVMDISESRLLTLEQAILRDGFYLLVAVTGLLYYGSLFLLADDPAVVLAEYSYFSLIPVLLWTLIELLTMLSNPRRRAAHDFLAGSVVIKT